MIKIYFGKSGSGKDFFLKRTLKKTSYKPIVCFTTRPMREGEIDGVDYFFTTKEKFLEKVNSGEIVEYRKYNTINNGVRDVWYYGSPRVNPDEDYVAVLDISGIESYIKAYGSDKIDLIFVMADEEIREQRVMNRGGFNKAEWDRRAVDDNEVFSKSNILKISEIYGKPILYINNNSNEDNFNLRYLHEEDL